MGMKTVLFGAVVFGMTNAGWAAGSNPGAFSEPTSETSSSAWVTAEVPQVDLASSISAGAHAPESLTVRFYAKVYLLPSADSPLLGITEDGGRLPLYRSKGAWAQIGFRNSTGWIQIGRPAGGLRWSRLETSLENTLLTLSMPVTCTAGAGGLMFAILGGVLWILSRRRRTKKIPGLHRGAELSRDSDRRMPCALEGRIITHGLAEILQFLEIGRRTGMLSVEDGHPAGVVNFDEGLITFAHTRRHEGMEAVMEILAMGDGAFHFFEDKKVKQTNCRLSALEVLLHHAHRVDELRNRVYRTGT